MLDHKVFQMMFLINKIDGIPNSDLRLKKKYHLRRKSCTCSLCGDPKLSTNQSYAMKIQNPGFVIKQMKHKVLSPNLFPTACRVTSLNLPMEKQITSQFKSQQRTNSMLMNHYELDQLSSSISSSETDSEKLEERKTQLKNKRKTLIQNRLNIGKALGSSPSKNKNSNFNKTLKRMSTQFEK